MVTEYIKHLTTYVSFKIISEEIIST